MAENRDKMQGYFSAQPKKDDDFERCRSFFDKLAEILKEKYIVVASCNKDLSAYLVPIGTEDQITYTSKPAFSFRVSDHWNWFSNKIKCDDLSIIQCYSDGVEYPIPRNPAYPEKATHPRHACQVAWCDQYGVYHPVYGDFWMNSKKKYSWKSNHTPEEVAAYVLKQWEEAEAHVTSVMEEILK